MKTIIRAEKIAGLCMVIIVALISTAATIKADFSGQWSFDLIKSNMNEPGMMTPMKMVVTQEKKAIIIQRLSRNSQDENISVIDNISFDGKETESTGFANFTRRSSMVWVSSSAFKVKIAISGTFDGNPINVSITEDWSLSADRNTLTIDRESNGPRGLLIAKYVYDREVISSRR